MDVRRAIVSVAQAANRVNAALCGVLLAILFLAQLSIVVLRYAFGMGFLELQDVVNYGFALLVMLGLPVAFASDSHVRVDIFRGRQGATARRRTDIFAVFCLLVPVFAMTLWLVMPQIVYSWSIREGAVETGGLPGFFLVKTAVPVACALLILHGLAHVAAWRDGGEADGK